MRLFSVICWVILGLMHLGLMGPLNPPRALPSLLSTPITKARASLNLSPYSVGKHRTPNRFFTHYLSIIVKDSTPMYLFQSPSTIQGVVEGEDLYFNVIVMSTAENTQLIEYVARQ